MDEGYHSDTDIWSLGLSLLECAIGRFPYPEPDEFGQCPVLSFWELINYIYSQPAPIPSTGFSPEMQDFLRICLGKTSGSRSTASALLAHPFIVKNSNPISFNIWLEGLPTR
jgi:serine/threonine protein kinase